MVEEGTAVSHKGRLLKSRRPARARPLNEALVENGAEGQQEEASQESLRALVRDALSSNNPLALATVGERVGALNRLVRLLAGWRRAGVRGNDALLAKSGFSMEQILLAARCLLTSDSKEVRAGALRLIRYLVRSLEDVYLLQKLHIDILIARSLDVVVDNRQERVHCLRLINHLLVIFYQEVAKTGGSGRSWSDSTDSGRSAESRSGAMLEWTSPYSFPHAVIRPLIALSLQGIESSTGHHVSGQDELARAATGLLCELSVVCPDLVLSVAGTGWMVRSLLGSISAVPRLAEVVAAVPARWLDQAAFRRRQDVACLLDELVAPLTEPLYRFADLGEEAKAQPASAANAAAQDERVLPHCRMALVALLRTWPGLLTALSVSKPIRTTHSPLALLVDSLGLLRNDRTRSVILEILCELLGLPYAEAELSSWAEAVAAREEGKRGDGYEAGISEGFLVSDAQAILASVPAQEGRPELLSQFTALTLYGLLSADVLEALVRVVLTEQENSLGRKATLLIGDILRLTREWVGGEWRDVSLSLASAVASLTAPPAPRDRGKVSEADARLADPSGYAAILLHRLDSLREADESPAGRKLAWNLSTRRQVRRAELRRDGPSPPAEGSLGGILDAPKLRLADGEWDWPLVGVYLRGLLSLSKASFKRRTEDPRPIQELLAYFNPLNKDGFAGLTGEGREAGEVGCLLMWVLGRGAGLAKEAAAFLRDLAGLLTPAELSQGPLSLSQVVRSASVEYFTMLGELTATELGASLLQAAGIQHRLLELMSPDTSEVHVKLLLSSLDFSRPGFTRSVLQKALNGTSKKSRVYATELLGVWARLDAEAFAGWGVEMLALQLLDPAEAVVAAAVQVLSEALWSDACCAALGALEPPMLESLGEAGWLVRAHLFRLPAYVEREGEAELGLWADSLHLRYVHFVEEALTAGLTHYQRSAAGAFPRHSNMGAQSSPTVQLPPHLLGQLGASAEGRRLLTSSSAQIHVNHLVRTLRYGGLEGAEEWERMGAALWGLGHLGSSDAGLALLPADLPAVLVKLAEESPVLSVRGLAFSALNLIAQCDSGRKALEALGWLTSLVPSMRGSEERFLPSRTPAHSLLSQASQGSLKATERRGSQGSAKHRHPSGASSHHSASATSQGGEGSLVSNSSQSQLMESLTSERSYVQLTGPVEEPGEGRGDRGRGLSLLLAGAGPSEVPLPPLRPLRVACCEYDDGGAEPGELRSVRSGRSKSLGAVESAAVGSGRLSQSPGYRKTSRAASIREEDMDGLEAAPHRSHSVDAHDPDSSSPQVGSIVTPLQPLNLNRLPQRKPPRQDDSEESDDGTGFLVSLYGEERRGEWRSWEEWEAPPSPVEDSSAELRRRLGFQLIPHLPRAHPRLVNDPLRLWRDAGVPPAAFMGAQDAHGFRRLSAQNAQAQGSASGDSSPSALLSYGLEYLDSWTEFRSAPMGSGLSVRRSKAQLGSVGRPRPSPVCLPVDIRLVTGRFNDLPVGTFSSPYETDGGAQMAGLPSPRVQRKVGVPGAFGARGRAPLGEEEVMGLRAHLSERCLHCAPEGEVKLHSDSGESGLADMWETPPRSRAATSGEEGPAEKTDKAVAGSSAAVRREVLRLVCGLDVRRAAAETGLVRLREEWPASFASLCLYSDVAALLSRYRFRLSARRFLQELFLDLDFGPLWTLPDAIFGLQGPDGANELPEEDEAS